MPRVALVVPLFPPDSGGGVFRALKLAPLLPLHGWEPTIYTVENPGVPQDPTLLEEVPRDLPVIRIPAGAVRRLQRGPLRKLGVAFEALGLTASAAAQWDHLALTLIEHHRQRPYDLLFSTSPPPATHRTILAALDHFPTDSAPPWVADFRDPWRRAFSYRPASDPEAAADIRDEGRSLFLPRLITTTVHASMLATCMEHSLTGDRLVWVPNGYDPGDVADLPSSPALTGPPTASNPIRFGYSGSLYGAYNLDQFLDGLQFLLGEHPELASAIRLELFGTRSKETLERVRRAGLTSQVTFHGYVAHREALRAMAECHWVIVNMPLDPRAQDTVSGKLYEYLGARMPVLAFASRDGQIAKLLRQTGGGRVIEARDAATVARELWAVIQGGAPLEDPTPSGFTDFRRRYSRVTVAAEMAEAFNRALTLPPQRRPT